MSRADTVLVLYQPVASASSVSVADTELLNNAEQYPPRVDYLFISPPKGDEKNPLGRGGRAVPPVAVAGFAGSAGLDPPGRACSPPALQAAPSALPTR